MVFVLFLILNLFSQKYAVKFGMAFESYLKGDYRKAVKILEDILSKDPNNKKALDLFSKSINKIVNIEEKNKNYEKALFYIKKGLKFVKSDELLNKKKKIENKIGKGKIRKKKKLKKEVKKKDVKKTVKRKKTEVKKEWLKGEKKKVERKMVRKGKKEKDSFSGFIYILLLINLAGVLFLVYLFITQLPKKEEEKLLLQERRISQLITTFSTQEVFDSILQKQKEILDKLERIPRAENTIKEQALKLTSLIEKLTRGTRTMKLELPPGSRREVITDINPLPRVRADTVELIGEMFDDPVLVEEMLEPYLNDENNRVLGNACKVLFKYNRRRSLEILKDMVNSEDKWMRATACWVFGEIGEDVGIPYLRQLLNDNERVVRIRAVKSFWKLKKKGIPIPREIELKIQEIEKDENLKVE